MILPMFTKLKFFLSVPCFFFVFSSCVSIGERDPSCPLNSVLVSSPSRNVNICVDRYESTLAKSDLSKALPIANVNYYQCKRYCERQNKRLLTNFEWRVSCEGTNPRYCNRNQPHPIHKKLKSKKPWYYKGMNCKNPKNTWNKCMQDPSINKQKRTISRNDDFGKCVSKHGVHNMVGNLGEWVQGHRKGRKGRLYGRFNGGLYPQKKSSCSYTTVAHTLKYKDYSIGCRCAVDFY